MVAWGKAHSAEVLGVHFGGWMSASDSPPVLAFPTAGEVI